MDTTTRSVGHDRGRERTSDMGERVPAYRETGSACPLMSCPSVPRKALWTV